MVGPEGLNGAAQAFDLPYMDSSSFASKLLVDEGVRLLTYIRPLKVAYIDAGP